MTIGRKIAELRTASGLTQEQLAEKLYVSRELVSKWETNSRRPDHRCIVRLAELFGIGQDELISRSEEMISELSVCIPDTSEMTSEQLLAHINAFLATIRERDRSIFIRRYYYLEDISDIAEKYGISESYTRTVLMRVRRKFTKYLKEAGK